MGKNFKWTKERVEFLQENYATASWDVLISTLGAKKQCIMDKASALKLSRDVYNNCHVTKEEEEYVQKHCQEKSAAEIAKDLGRNTTFVCRVIKRLGLENYNRGLKPEDVELFKKIYPIYTNKYLNKKFFPYLDVQQLRTQARKFGLEKTEEKSIKWYDKEDLLEKLKEATTKLGRTPLLREFESLGLPNEVSFRRYFGSVTKAFELLNIERTDYNVVSAKYYDDNNNICYSKCEQEISNFLLSQKYDVEKEVLYNTVIPEELVGKRRFDWCVNKKYYIEFFGLMHLKDYQEDAEYKQKICQERNIKLLALYPKDFNKISSWKTKILEFINN